MRELQAHTEIEKCWFPVDWICTFYSLCSPTQSPVKSLANKAQDFAFKAIGVWKRQLIMTDGCVHITLLNIQKERGKFSYCLLDPQGNHWQHLVEIRKIKKKSIGVSHRHHLTVKQKLAQRELSDKKIILHLQNNKTAESTSTSAGMYRGNSR